MLWGGSATDIVALWRIDAVVTKVGGGQKRQ